MPPYTPVTSQAQSRKLFALARDGKMSMADAKGKTAAAGNFDELPEHAATQIHNTALHNTLMKGLGREMF